MHTLIRLKSIYPMLILLGLILIGVGLIAGMIRAALVIARKIEGNYRWIEGCSVEYLAALPESWEKRT